MLSEEMLVSLATGEVFGAGRNFAIMCETHGPQNWNQKPGRHGTVQESQLKKLFPKAARLRIKTHLSSDEWQVFSEALHGRRQATRDMVAYWMQLLKVQAS